MLLARLFIPIVVVSLLLIPSVQAQEFETLMSPNEEIDGEFGWAVGGGGDVNTDGIPDVIVGAFAENPGSSPWNAGRAYVFDGDDLSSIYTLLSPNEEQAGGFGYAVDLLGDVNGDGSEDIVVSAFRETPGTLLIQAGRVYVFNGGDGSLVHTLVSPNAQLGGWFGFSVSSAGDVNGDGHDDIIVGAHEEDSEPSRGGAGRAYVFSGQDGSVLHELVSPIDQNQGHFGYSVSSAGDVNDDGLSDVIVGARGESTGSSPDGAGRAYVFSGNDGAVIHTFMSPNEEIEGYFGNAVSGAGDVTGDSIPDLVVAADHEDPGTSPEEAGSAYVFDGHDGTLVYSLSSPNAEGEGFFGHSVDLAGDMDGDGLEEIMIGAFWEIRDPALVAAGRTYIFRGSDGSVLYTLISPTPEGGGFFGCSVSALGDLDGNGSDDVVIGAVFENPGESPQDAGRAHIFFSETQSVENGPMISVIPEYARLMSVGPNPAHDDISVMYSIDNDIHPAKRSMSLKIYDLSGRLLALRNDLSTENGKHLVKWSLRQGIIPSGHYVLTLSGQGTEVLDAATLVMTD